MNITHMVLNNHQLGKVSKEQRLAEWEVWQTSLVNPDFSQMAEPCGLRGFAVTTLDDLQSSIEQALARNGPALVDIVSDALLI